MNIAYTEKYTAWRQKCSEIFTPEHLVQPGKTEQLTDGFSVRSKFYAKEASGRLTASENDLMDRSGQIIYTWRNLDMDGEFFTLFSHSNGNHYLVFRTELYGYSVLEVESGKELHYVPSTAHPEEEKKFQETFIWTDVHYHPKANMLAVEGCYWACPNSVLLLDFSDPLREQLTEQWLEFHKIDGYDYDVYDSFDFDHWDENGDLWLEAFNIEKDKNEVLRIPLNQLKEWLGIS